MFAAGGHLLGDAEPGGQRIRVILAQCLLPSREHVPELVLRPAMFAAGGYLLGDGKPGGQRIRMGWSQLVLLISQSPLVKRDCLVRTPGLLVGRCQTSVSCQRVRVIQPQLVLLISQSPLVQRDCHIRVVSLKSERHPQCISEFPATGITTFGNFRKGSHQDVIHFRRKAGPPRRQPRRRHR